jgi:hypothetical protein
MTFPKVSGSFALASVTRRPRLATDVPGAVEYTGQSRATLYNDMRSGRLPAFKSGARTIIFFADLDRYMHGLPRAKFKPPGTAEPVEAAEGENERKEMARAGAQLEETK